MALINSCKVAAGRQEVVYGEDGAKGGEYIGEGGEKGTEGGISERTIAQGGRVSIDCTGL